MVTGMGDQWEKHLANVSECDKHHAEWTSVIAVIDVFYHTYVVTFARSPPYTISYFCKSLVYYIIQKVLGNRKK